VEKDNKILITGSTGMVGSRLLKLLIEKGYTNIIAPNRDELNLLSLDEVLKYFEKHCPEFVFMVAAKVGGIAANIENPVGFLLDNTSLQMNLFKSCYKYKVVKSVFLGSSCIYPRESAQPMIEEHILNGPFEPTNEAYALAKIHGIKLAEYYQKQFGMQTVCPILCNIYGTGDSYDLERSHVLSALIKRFVDAKIKNLSSVKLWGTGSAKREFIHVDDVALSLLYLMDNFEGTIINVGVGVDISINSLAEMIADYTGYRGSITWDKNKPDGMLRKCLDITKLNNLGFQAKVSLHQGIKRSLEEYYNIKKNK
jgi:GDP-L-fucose synthase